MTSGKLHDSIREVAEGTTENKATGTYPKGYGPKAEEPEPNAKAKGKKPGAERKKAETLR